MNNEIYKIYQLMDYFISNYNYENVLVQKVTKGNEIWLVDRSNKSKYPIIRISNSSLDATFSNRERIDACIKAIAQNIHSNTFLDIHISREKVTPMETYKTTCIEESYMDGEDISKEFLNVDKVIHRVDNPELEISARISNVNVAMREKLKNKYHMAKNKYPNIVTLSITAICILMRVITYFLTIKYSESYAYFILGGDYKPYTIYAHQYWRLITYAFLHGGIFHLFVNMYSFMIIGTHYELKLGKAKYAIVLFTGIIVGGLTHNIFSPTTLSVGLSGAIYTLFSFYIIEAIVSGAYKSPTFMSMVFINIALNFMPGVAWQTHMGGAIVGLLYYLMFKDKRINIQMVVLMVILVLAMIFRLIAF